MKEIKPSLVFRVERYLFWISFILTLFLFLIGLIIGFTKELFSTVKTITLLQYSCFLFSTFCIEEIINKQKNWIIRYRSILLKFSFLLIMALSYEVLWIFFFWFSNYNFYGIDINVDTLVYEPNQKIMEMFPQPINLNFYSKVIFLAFFLSLYFFYRISKLPDKI
jgi:hypothetical protein